MLLALLLVSHQLALGPSIAPGSNSEFHRAVLSVEEALARSDFTAAQERLRLLPKQEVKIRWNDRKVPADLRASFAAARNHAFTIWRGAFLHTSYTVIEDGQPDITFSFEPVLAKPEGKPIPPPSVLFFSDSPSDPRLECVIGLKRGAPLTPTTDVEVSNEVAYGIGSYFGLAPSPFIGWTMGRPETAGQVASSVGRLEAKSTTANFALVATLTKDVQERKPVSPTHPSSFADPTTIDLGTVTQGQLTKFSFQLTNRGDAPLLVDATPDCGCVGVMQVPALKAGASTLVQGRVDTRELRGDFHRRVLLAVNDPDVPYREIGLNIHVNPLYEFSGPSGDKMNLEDGDEFRVILGIAPGANLKPTDAFVSGIKGAVSFEPWSSQEPGPAGFKTGYVFKVKVDGEDVTGLRYAQVQIATNDKSLPSINYSFKAQRGIVALPNPLFLGDLSAKPRQFSLEVSRPHKAFKIANVVVDVPHLSARLPQGASETFKLTLDYDGKADSGIFKGTIKVFTDDATQREIDVPFSASVQ